MAKLTQEALEWLYNFQEVLNNDFAVDTQNPGDLGRVHVCSFYNAVQDENGEFVAQEPVDNNAKMDADKIYKLDDKYAFAKIDTETDKYAPAFNEEVPVELINAQKGFRVNKDENGSYSIDSELSEDQLMYLYEKAKNGLLYVNGPDHAITINGTEKKSAVIAVGKNNEVLKLGTEFESAGQLSNAQFDKLLENHPEFKGLDAKNRAYTPNHDDVINAACLEFGEYSKTNDPDLIQNRYKNIVARLQARSVEEDTYKGFHQIEYYNNFWKKKDSLDDYKKIYTRQDDFYVNYGLSEMFENHGVVYDGATETGVDRLFYYDNNEHKLVNVADTVPKDHDPDERRRLINDQILAAKSEGLLYAFMRSIDVNSKDETLYKIGGEGNRPQAEKVEHPETLANAEFFDRVNTTSFGLNRLFDEHDAEFDINRSKGMDRLYYYDEKDQQLVPIDNGLNESDPEYKKTVKDRIMAEKKNGNLFAFLKDTSAQPAKETMYRVEGEGTKLDVKPAEFRRPSKPNFLKQIMHKIKKSWFEKDFADYEKAKFRKEYLEIMKQESDRRKFSDTTEEKPKTRSMDQVYDRLASTILTARNDLPTVYYLKVRDVKKEDVLNGQAFKAFVHEPQNQKDILNSMNGKHVEWPAVARRYFEYLAPRMGFDKKGNVKNAEKVANVKADGTMRVNNANDAKKVKAPERKL